MKSKNYFYLLLPLFIYGCSPFKGEPDLSFDQGNVLKPKVKFELKTSTEAWIEFWPEAIPEYRRITNPVSAASHLVTLMNLTEETRYKFRMITIDPETGDTLRSREFNFMTGVVPSEVVAVRKDKIDTTLFSGYILIRRFFKSGADVLLNNKGQIVWYHLYDTAVRRPVTYTKQGTFLSIYDSAVIRETDIYGRTLLNVDLEQLEKPERFHHEVLFDSAENILSLSVDSAKRDLRRWGGTRDQYLRADGIVRMDKSGKILWKWNLLDANDPNDFRDTVNIRDVWGHANAMVIDRDGNYLVSFRDFSQVWKIHSQTGKVIWKLGKGGDFKMSSEGWFLRQHSISWTKDGDLIMFDNGNRKIRPQSRVLVLRLDQKNMTAYVVNLIDLPRAYTSYRMGSAQKIDDSHFLVCVTKKDATLLIIDKKGLVKWKAVGNHASYRAELIEKPFPF
ncbi:MAG: aryl-sulfate sulfotransferase [Cyclobacteriaceae bacterium]